MKHFQTPGKSHHLTHVLVKVPHISSVKVYSQVHSLMAFWLRDYSWMAWPHSQCDNLTAGWQSRHDQLNTESEDILTPPSRQQHTLNICNANQNKLSNYPLFCIQNSCEYLHLSHFLHNWTIDCSYFIVKKQNYSTAFILHTLLLCWYFYEAPNKIKYIFGKCFCFKWCTNNKKHVYWRYVCGFNTFFKVPIGTVLLASNSCLQDFRAYV